MISKILVFNGSEEDQSSRSSGRLESGNSISSKSPQCNNRSCLSAMTSSVCGKIFWVLLVACGTAILIYGLYRTRTNRVILSQNGAGSNDSPSVLNPQQQQWSNYYDIVPRTEMEFPKVYICPSNYINNTYLQNMSGAEQLLRLYRRSLIVQPVGGSNNNNNRTKREETKDKFKTFDNTSTEDVYKTFMSIGYDQDELFMACSFRSFFTALLPCKSIVRSVLDPNFGKCYLVSVDDTRKQQIPGQGMILVLNLNQNLFPTSRSLAPITRGYIVRIGREVDPSDFRFVYVASGTYTKVDLFEEQVVYDNGECVRVDENRMKLLAGNYSQSGCLLDCLLQTIQQTCNCVPLMDHFFLKNTEDNKPLQYCTMETIDECVLPNVTSNLEATYKIEQCRSACLPSCQNWHFDVKTTHVPLNPDAGVVKSNGMNVSDVMYLHVAFSNLETKVFHQYRPTSSAFLPSSAEMLSPNVEASTPQHESLWVVAGIALLIQIPTAIALICLFALYRQMYKALPTAR